MRTLTLRGGERVVVVAERWHDAFGVVVRGRVQLELRDGEPGPVLGRDAGFWLRGTGVRALRNPGRRAALVRILTPARPRTPMPERRRNPMNHTHRFRGLAGLGLLATLAAMAATALVAASARAAGVDVWISGAAVPIPPAGFAVVTGFFSIAGVALALGFLRWSSRPAGRFVVTAVALTTISLIPPIVAGADSTAAITLIVLHLVAAAVMIPVLTRGLRSRTRREA